MYKINHNNIGTFSYINCRYGVDIENGVQIGSHGSIYSHSTIDDKQVNWSTSQIQSQTQINDNSIVSKIGFVYLKQ